MTLPSDCSVCWAVQDWKPRLSPHSSALHRATALLMIAGACALHAADTGPNGARQGDLAEDGQGITVGQNPADTCYCGLDQITVDNAKNLRVARSFASDGPAPQPVADDRAGENHQACRVLRVAADPNNLPFSNSRLEGFENRIVALLAKELDATVEYTWLPQRRGFFRQTMKEGSCDVVAGVPKGFGRTLTTSPYYKSGYVFLTRSDQRLDIRSFDDIRLRQLQIGVQMIGDDDANTPPAQALADRGMVDNVHGYTVFGDYAEGAPLAKIVDAVARGEIDVAVVWGPLAGYYAKHYAGVLALAPVATEDQARPLPVTFDICLGVHRNEPELRDELNTVIAKKRSEIEAILNEYGVPLADASP